MNFVPVAPARKCFVVRAVSDRLRIGLSTQYFEGASDLMKSLGFSWFVARRMWVAKVDEMKSVLSKLDTVSVAHPGWNFDDMRDMALAAYKEPELDFFTSLLDVQLMPLDGGGFACTGEYDPLFLQALRELNGKFHGPAKAWELRRQKDEVLSHLNTVAGIDPAFVYVHEQHMHFEQLVGRSKSDVPISLDGARPPERSGASERPTGIEGNGFLTSFGTPLQIIDVDERCLVAESKRRGLRDYQVDGVRFLLSRTAALLGDDCGLGKTRQAIVAGYLASNQKPILVICPASLGINWEREIHALYPEASVAFAGVSSMAECESSKWVIANYERLAGLVKSSIRFEVMLVDEAHSLKEVHAGRTRNAFVLAERIPRTFLLTGTPILNREVEIHTLLRLSGHPIGRMALGDFKKAYAGSSEARALLASRLPEWMLRRGKDVLTDLGVKTHQVRYIEPAGGLATYNQILKDPSLQSMPKLTKLREHLEFLKTDFIVESIAALPRTEKALVFCEFTDTVELLLKAFRDVGIGAVSVVGSDTARKRMAAVDALQCDDGVSVFIGTTKAAGVGLTLTRANYVYMASLPWTNALKQQAEDRAYRSGNKRDVFVIVPLVANTIDERVLTLLDSKGEIADDIVESNRISVLH